MSESTPFRVNYIRGKNPKQDEFHNDRYKVSAQLCSAGTGGGKTYAGLMQAFYYTIERPGSVGVICEPTYGMLDRILVRQTFPEFFGCALEDVPLVVKYNKTKNFVDWKPMYGHKKGSHWELVGLDEPERAEGISVDWIWADEFRLVGGSGPSAHKKQETALNVFTRRLRGSGYGRWMGYKPALWLTMTPDAPKSVTHNNFENADPKLNLENSKVYRWSIDDNVFLTEDYRRRVKAKHVPGTGLYLRFVKGLFAAIGVGSYPFDYQTHVFEDPLGRNRIKFVVYGVDWGWTNPACLLVIAFDGDFRAYIVEEFYQARCPIETLAKYALEMEARWGRGKWFCDRSEPRSIDEFKKAGLHAFPDKSKRDDGIHEMGGRFLLAGDKRPRLKVHKSCVNWISEVQGYDSNVKQGDHAMDCTRYILANVQLVDPGWYFG